MPSWVVDIFKGGLLLSLVSIAWKLAWALRGWVESQRTRAENEGKILSALERLGDLIEKGLEEQRTTSEKMWTAINVHSMRLNKLEGRGNDGGAD
ncbi:MAG TPA: hypothetical protein VGZ29_05675 [Terriglobia bacterium]|nr:hypothetical protein [Terriglobia bacterium]